MTANDFQLGPSIYLSGRFYSKGDKHAIYAQTLNFGSLAFHVMFTLFSVWWIYR